MHHNDALGWGLGAGQQSGCVSFKETLPLVNEDLSYIHCDWVGVQDSTCLVFDVRCLRRKAHIAVGRRLTLASALHCVPPGLKAGSTNIGCVYLSLTSTAWHVPTRRAMLCVLNLIHSKSDCGRQPTQTPCNRTTSMPSHPQWPTAWHCCSMPCSHTAAMCRILDRTHRVVHAKTQPSTAKRTTTAGARQAQCAGLQRSLKPLVVSPTPTHGLLQGRNDPASS